MKEEILDKANNLKNEINQLEYAEWLFSRETGFIDNTKVRVGFVKRKKSGLYTINDNYGNPVDEIVLPDELKEIFYNEIIKLKRQKEKELEEL